MSYTKPNTATEAGPTRGRGQPRFTTPETEPPARAQPTLGSSNRSSSRSSNRSRLGLMENFWGIELAEVSSEVDSGQRSELQRDTSPGISQDTAQNTPQTRRQRASSAGDAAHDDDEDYDKFFTESVFNPKLQAVTGDASVCRRIQVGLYPEDAELLEEIFAQSKAAGLKGVSRARILRVALRHFHTCWLNAD